MAMDSGVLAALIRSELEGAGFNVNGTGKDGVAWMLSWSEAIATAIVDHITDNAKATGTDFGVYPGSQHNLDIG